MQAYSLSHLIHMSPMHTSSLSKEKIYIQDKYKNLCLIFKVDNHPDFFYQNSLMVSGL